MLVPLVDPSPFDSRAVTDFSSHADIPSSSSSPSTPAGLGVVSSFDDRPRERSRNAFPSPDATSTSEFVSSLTPAATVSSPTLAEEIAAQQVIALYCFTFTTQKYP